MRIRRGNEIIDATADTVLKEGDVVGGRGRARSAGRGCSQNAVEVDDRELLAVPVEGVDVLVTNKAVDGKTLAELATNPATRGVFLNKITRGATATDIPDPAGHRGQSRRPAQRRRSHAGHLGGDQAARRRGPSDRRHRHGVCRRRGRRRRADRRAGLQDFRRAAYAVDRRRRADRRHHRRMAALGASILRSHSDAHRLVHELRRPQCLHCRSSASPPVRASSMA